MRILVLLHVSLISLDSFSYDIYTDGSLILQNPPSMMINFLSMQRPLFVILMDPAALTLSLSKLIKCLLLYVQDDGFN